MYITLVILCKKYYQLFVAQNEWNCKILMKILKAWVAKGHPLFTETNWAQTKGKEG